ncbi:MAG: hypothetical protein M1834_006337 [Cirrosporium novae-zelandiae]|nr:MAG: hypothetical protein M1834_006337 [Cirrosporium novae-zelandiae]
MVYYLNFVSTPKISFDPKEFNQEWHVQAKISITSDLQEELYPRPQDIYIDLITDEYTLSQTSQYDTSLCQGRHVSWDKDNRVLKIDSRYRASKEIQGHTNLQFGRPLTHFRMEVTMIPFPKPVLSPSTLPLIVGARSGELKLQGPSTPSKLDKPFTVEATREVQRVFSLYNGTRLYVNEAMGQTGLSGHVWDASLGLVAYLNDWLEYNDTIANVHADSKKFDIPILHEILLISYRRKLKIIELGTGCGLVGILLAQLISHCDVAITDQDNELAQINIKYATPAKSSTVTFETLRWEEELPASLVGKRFDLVIISDCTYNTDSFPALVGTISRLAEQEPDIKVIIATKVRNEEEKIFFPMMKKAGFKKGGLTHEIPIPGIYVGKGQSPSKRQIDVHSFIKAKRI